MYKKTHTLHYLQFFPAFHHLKMTSLLYERIIGNGTKAAAAMIVSNSNIGIRLHTFRELKFLIPVYRYDVHFALVIGPVMFIF